MKFLLLVAIFSLTGCSPKTELVVPLEEINFESKSDLSSVEKKLQTLYSQVSKIEEKEIVSKLGENEALAFSNRMRELKESINNAVLQIKKSYTDEEMRDLKVEYIKAEEIWNYIIKNFPV